MFYPCLSTTYEVLTYVQFLIITKNTLLVYQLMGLLVNSFKVLYATSH